MVEDMRRCYKMLSAREQEIMTFITDGKMNKMIAHMLHISIKTVELHRANIMQKMKARNLAELVKMQCSMQLNHDLIH